MFEQAYRNRINKVIKSIIRDPCGDWTTHSLASLAGISAFHFHRIFRALTGETMFAFLQRRRLLRAIELINEGGFTLTETALECGFDSGSSLSRAFRKNFHRSPTQYRKRQHPLLLPPPRPRSSGKNPMQIEIRLTRPRAALIVERKGLLQTGQAILLAILVGGLSAGVLDFIGACISNAPRGVTPLRVAQSIASGLLGRAAFNGGYKTAALGVALHFMIALGAAAVFCVASDKLRWLVERPYLSGALYGIAVYWFMQLIVLPLSAIPFKQNFSWPVVVTGLVVHVLCVGWPIALAMRWYAK